VLSSLGVFPPGRRRQAGAVAVISVPARLMVGSDRAGDGELAPVKRCRHSFDGRRQGQVAGLRSMMVGGHVGELVLSLP
jgi:hypothetical protein